MPNDTGTPPKPTRTPFLPSFAKVTIASIEPGVELFVRAQYNPKELQINQTIDWHEHETLQNEHPDAMFLEFGGMKPETMQVELLFDGFENDGKVGRAKDTAEPQSVTDRINIIKTLASPRPHADPTLRRPHYCVVTWGEQNETQGIPRLRCIIESVSTKYLMFSSEGVVLRASCTVSLKSADRVALAKQSPPKNRVAKRPPNR
jgi:hypothetical protein